MPSRKHRTAAPAAAEPQAPPAPPPPAVHVIDPNAIYSKLSARAALGLKANTLPREIRLGRLRASQRAGKMFILGEWLLEWLRAGEMRRRAAAGPRVAPDQADADDHSAA